MSDDQQKGRYRALRPQLQVRIRSEGTEPITVHPATPDLSSSASADVADKEEIIQPATWTTETSPTKSIPFWRPENLPRTLQWIPANWSWSKWKPVIRSALAAWISLLLFLIPTTLNVMGQVSFFCSYLHFTSSEELPVSLPDHHR